MILAAQELGLAKKRCREFLLKASDRGLLEEIRADYWKPTLKLEAVSEQRASLQGATELPAEITDLLCQIMKACGFGVPDDVESIEPDNAGWCVTFPSQPCYCDFRMTDSRRMQWFDTSTPYLHISPHAAVKAKTTARVITLMPTPRMEALLDRIGQRSPPVKWSWVHMEL